MDGYHKNYQSENAVRFTLIPSSYEYRLSVHFMVSTSLKWVHLLQYQMALACKILWPKWIQSVKLG